MLKNSIISHDGWKTSNTDAERQALAYVKSTILVGLQDQDQMIRQTVGAVITSLLGSEEPGGWPEALEALTTGKGSQDTNVVEVCAFLSPRFRSLTCSPYSIPLKRSPKIAHTSSTSQFKASTSWTTSFPNSSNSPNMLLPGSVITPYNASTRWRPSGHRSYPPISIRTLNLCSHERPTTTPRFDDPSAQPWVSS